MKRLKIWLAACLALSLSGWTSNCAAVENTRLVQKFVKKMVNKHHFEAATLNALFKSAKLKKDILKAISKPAEKHTPWYQYQKMFVTEQRIRGGVQFWRENQQTLAVIAQKYGVPAEIIVAIIGVETFYGQNSGHYRVIDALSTLGFFYPKL